MYSRSRINWTELLVGIISIVVGIYAITRPQQALNTFAVVFGILALIMGIADIAFYIQMERHTGFGPVIEMVAGIINILIGLFLIIYSKASVFAASVMFAAWIIAHSIGRLINSDTIKLLFGKGVQYYLSLIVNILGIVLGVLMLIKPVASIISIALIIAVYLIVSGIIYIVLSFSRY